MSQSTLIFAADYAESFRRGVVCPVPPRVTLQVDPATLTEEDRQLIAARLAPTGEVARRSDQGRYHSGRGDAYESLSQALKYYESERGLQVVTAAEPTIAGLVAAIQQEEAAIAANAALRAAEEAAKNSAELDRAKVWLARPVSDFVSPRRIKDRYVSGWGHVDGHAALNDYSGDYRTPNASKLPPDVAAQVTSREQTIRAEVNRLNDAIVAELEGNRRERRQERADWIAAHGSARLKRLAAEGIEHDKTYEAERAKYEQAEFDRQLEERFPGWRVVAADAISYDVADVSSRSLALLDAARALMPTCKLAKLKDGGKIVAAGEFLGRTIIWPRD